MLKIDNREPEIIKTYFQESKDKLNIDILFENLEQADFLIYNSDNEILMIIERKSISDLLSSVKDNRYAEQSNRLLELRENLNINENNIIYYIIEGNRNNIIPDSTEFKTFYSCIFSLNYKKKFNLLLSNSINETIVFITEFITRLCSNKYNNDIKNTNVKSLIKKEIPTRTNIGAIMLSSVPDIGYNTASNILKYYNNSIYEFIQKLKVSEENIKILEEFKINNRKLSKKIIKNIKDYLL